MKIGVFLSMFPEAHETFILRELVELERQGVQLEIFSLQTPRDPPGHPEAERLQRTRTHYGSLFGRAALGALLRTAVARPGRLLRALAVLVRAGWREPVMLAKALAILPLALRFGEEARARGIRHLHGHWLNVPTTACWLLGMIHDHPWSAAIHGENIFTGSRLLARKLADARFIAVCTGYSWRYLREAMGLPRPEDIHLNYHGLEPGVWARAETLGARPPSAERERPRIVTVGRLFTFKGHDVLLRALARLREAGRDVELRLIGEGPEEEPLRRLAEGLGLSESVAFLGRVPFAQVQEELAAADLSVLASVVDPDGLMDGIPNVLAEAMAFGTPVVSTTVSGIPELVEDGVSGLLVPPRDPEALAEAMRRVLDDPDLAARLAEGGRARVRAMFDQRKNVAELVTLFDRYVDGPAPPPERPAHA